jgi:endonuclease/exonuclease/phosphatase family metal-dependent hydrolase
MKRSKKKNGWVVKLLLAFNFLFVICLLISYLAAYINPDDYWMIAFFGLSYPFLVIINFIFIIIWLIFRRKYALFSAIVIIIGFNVFFRIVQSSKKYEASELKDAYKVVSYNVRNFCLYNNSNPKEPYLEKNKILSFLKKESPDILCLQEYVNYIDNSYGNLQMTDTLQKLLPCKNAHTVYTSVGRKVSYFGIATFTNFPILDTGRIAFKTVSGNICIYTDVKINEDTVRIYNVHFESIRLKSEDYMFAEKLATKPEVSEDLNKNSRRILSRLKKAFIIRAPQVRLVADHIEKCPYPIILCGDFNDTPTSYAYHMIAKNLTDAFVEAGNGIGQTYAGIFPSFRIDYIMHSKEFKAYNFETVEEEVSDHYPVKCYIKKNMPVK